jgi:hypothetical protein
MPDPIDLSRISTLTWAFVARSLVESSLPLNGEPSVRERPYV